MKPNSKDSIVLLKALMQLHKVDLDGGISFTNSPSPQ